jgi:hypothetical protein
MSHFEFSDGIAPPGQEGWTRHQEKYREASFDGADGVVVQDQTEMFSNLNHHPVCAASDASHFLLTAAATPPVQEYPKPPLWSGEITPRNFRIGDLPEDGVGEGHGGGKCRS